MQVVNKETAYSYGFRAIKKAKQAHYYCMIYQCAVKLNCLLIPSHAVSPNRLQRLSRKDLTLLSNSISKPALSGVADCAECSRAHNIRFTTERKYKGYNLKRLSFRRQIDCASGKARDVSIFRGKHAGSSEGYFQKTRWCYPPGETERENCPC